MVTETISDFLDIAKDYKFTKAGNLARYSAGICYLHLGNFRKPLIFSKNIPKRIKLSDPWLWAQLVMLMLNWVTLIKVSSKYIEAADYAENSFNTPLFLMKAAELYELAENYADALKLYERIQK